MYTADKTIIAIKKQLADDYVTGKHLRAELDMAIGEERALKGLQDLCKRASKWELDVVGKLKAVKQLKKTEDTNTSPKKKQPVAAESDEEQGSPGLVRRPMKKAMKAKRAK